MDFGSNSGRNILDEMYKMSQAAKAKTASNVVKGLAGPAASIASGVLDVSPTFEKYQKQNPGAGPTEVATSPQGSKAIAGTLGAAVGSQLGAELGSMSPVSKVPATIAGATAGGMIGSELAKILTGIPAVDELIRKVYEKEVFDRQAKEAQAKIEEETKSSSK
jgi:outer membrane lipoprotein SlyB